MQNISPINTIPQRFHVPSEPSTSNSPTPAQQDSQEASPSSPGPRRDNPSPALLMALTDLPKDVKVAVAKSLDRTSILNLRSTCKEFKSAASEAIKHVKVERIGDLEAAIAAYKEGGIKALTVADRNLSDDDLLRLKNLPGLEQLEQLNLNGNQLTDAGLAHLHSLTSLEKLDLGKCYRLTNAGVKLLKNQLENCDVEATIVGRVANSDMVGC